MSKIFAIVNQKGGVGKTTTALALGYGLASLGHSVLMVDLDAQANFSFTAGVAKNVSPTVRDLLIGDADASTAIQHTPYGDIIPSSPSLAGMDAILTKTGKEMRLRESLEPVLSNYDFIVLDTPPALGIVTVNALTACNSVVIPAQADIYSLQGVEGLADTIQLVKKYTNPNLRIEGLLLTRYSPRSVLGREVAELAKDLADKLGTKVFSTTIREGVAVKESQISQESLFEYAPKASVTEDYRGFIKELLGEGGGE